jgi:AcrR family transcriptional regulator
MIGGMSEAAEPPNEDGRRARRDRNKYAVVDAYLDLVRAGNGHPGVAEVAERSGVSHRSVFRYFADREELVRTAIERQHAFARPLVALTVGPGAPIDERIEGFIERRLELFDALAPVARLSRSIADGQPIIADELRATRRFLRSQIEHLFHAELSALPTEDAAASLAVLDVICSFESVELMRRDQDMSHRKTAQTIERAIRQLLQPG